MYIYSAENCNRGATELHQRTPKQILFPFKALNICLLDGNMMVQNLRMPAMNSNSGFVH